MPASNTKLFTLYAGMKYLGDSLVGINVFEYESRVVIIPTGDPTLLHPGFNIQNVYEFLKNTKKRIWAPQHAPDLNGLGMGWAWDDYNSTYMTERSALPIYGNLVRFSGTKNNIKIVPAGVVSKMPQINSYELVYVNRVNRSFRENDFIISKYGKNFNEIEVPFITSEQLSFKLLSDTIKQEILWHHAPPAPTGEDRPIKYLIHSQPSDSLFKPMMHKSDNFFAEQTLLMVSDQKLGIMNDVIIIDTLLNTDLKDVPQKPRWVDGSGLSRYNMFTPQSFIYILNKIKTEFGFDRIKNILPTGGTGTLKNYYVADSSVIYAKTGTLSNHLAFSGYLITKNNKLLIFSILVNHYQTGATPVRRAIEHFLHGIIKKY